MVTTSTTIDSEGAVTATTDTVPTATVFFGRKNGLPNFSNEEFSLFVQVPLTEGTSPEAIEKQVDDASALVKTLVYKQLGVAVEVQANGVIKGEVPVAVEKPAKARRSAPSGGAPARKQLSDDDKNDLWASLAGAEADGSHWKAQDGELIYDNRVGKTNPRGPDFKFKDSGHGLWLSDKPEWFNGPGEGITL